MKTVIKLKSLPNALNILGNHLIDITCYVDAINLEDDFKDDRADQPLDIHFFSGSKSYVAAQL